MVSLRIIHQQSKYESIKRCAFDEQMKRYSLVFNYLLRTRLEYLIFCHDNISVNEHV